MKRRERLELREKKKRQRAANRLNREQTQAAIDTAFADNMPTRPGRPGLKILLENIPLPTDNTAKQLAMASSNGNGTGHI